MPIRSIDAPTVLGVLKIVEKRGAIETAKRLRQRISSVFVDAISSGRGDADPLATAPAAHAPDPASALDQANAALSNGASADQISTALDEAGVPELQWPKALQEQLRSRQIAVGLNP